MKPHQDTSKLLAALQTAYDHIRKQHTEIPPAVIVLTPNEARRPRYGYIRFDTWTSTKDGAAPQAEVGITSEHLARGADEVLSTLIHESVHAYCHATGKKDTSRQGRWHNKTFAEYADLFGLIVEVNAQFGAVTWRGMKPETKKTYAEARKLLRTALTGYRIAPALEDPKERVSYVVELTCECHRHIKINTRDEDPGDIRCDRCGGMFE